ncbi:MAG: nicotinate phosphoribosyltransferase [Actinobacteria bacterium]|nr:MAG: nicotinate phosphoribosyltransferase [Actinomycetota bacterium]
MRGGAASREGGFNVATPEEIRDGRVTDVYLLRGREVLEQEGENPQVVAEVRAGSLPAGWTWAILAGLGEAVHLLEDRGVEVQALAEGSVFYTEEPVMVLFGRYLDFGTLETSLLGLLCQASGIATAAGRVRLAAGTRPVYSFGARRMHPAIAPMIERAAYIGGCDGVAVVKSAEVIGLDPVGTMAHSLTLILGEERAWRGFDRTMDPRIPRVALVDTFQDEKFGAVAAAQLLGNGLSAVRLDTPANRRGNLASLLREVRWELDERGFRNVKLFVSGGIDEGKILELNRYADSYGVGTAISNAPVVDFAMDIVEVNGEARAKRGKLSGRKHLWGCPECGNRGIASGTSRLGDCPRCGHRVRSLLETQLSAGKRRRTGPSAKEIRSRTLEEIAALPDPFRRMA